MKKYSDLPDVIKQVKTLSESLTSAEKEQLRDELLAFFLFSEFNKTNCVRECDKNVTMQSLTEEERILIKKLAEQTEALYRAQNRGEDLSPLP